MSVETTVQPNDIRQVKCTCQSRTLRESAVFFTGMGKARCHEHVVPISVVQYDRCRTRRFFPTNQCSRRHMRFHADIPFVEL